MNIRKYTAEDKQGCLNAFASNNPEYFTPEKAPEFEKWLDKNASEEPVYPNCERDFYYVVETGEGLVGCGGFYKVKDSDEVRFAWGLIHNSMHGKGYGTALYEYRIKIIKSLYPAAKITLGTSQHSFRFFEKMGMKVLNTIPNGYGEGMDRYDME